jgi:hypothetical protein
MSTALQGIERNSHGHADPPAQLPAVGQHGDGDLVDIAQRRLALRPTDAEPLAILASASRLDGDILSL